MPCDDGEDAFSDYRRYGLASDSVVEDVFEVRLKCHGVVRFDVHFWLGGKMRWEEFCFGNERFMRRTGTVPGRAGTAEELVDGGLPQSRGCHVMGGGCGRLTVV